MGGGTAVYGAAFDDELKVVHKRVTKMEDCYIFCGSKYVESNLRGIFSKVAEDLNQGIFVIFTGTPCQLNALNYYLEKRKCKNENLLTVDLLCHGAPSAKLWSDYKGWLENKYHSKLTKYSFRYKGDGKKKRMKYPVQACFENGIILEDTYLSRLYIELFFTELIYRDSCYSCKFSKPKRCSDITLGDFWEYKLVIGKPQKRPDLGMSMILVSTAKGQSVATKMQEIALSNADVYMEKCNASKLLEVKKNFGASRNNSEAVKIFRNEYNSFGIEYILKKYAGLNPKGHIKHILKKMALKTGLLPILSEMRGH